MTLRDWNKAWLSCMNFITCLRSNTTFANMGKLTVGFLPSFKVVNISTNFTFSSSMGGKSNRTSGGITARTWGLFSTAQKGISIISWLWLWFILWGGHTYAAISWIYYHIAKLSPRNISCCLINFKGVRKVLSTKPANCSMGAYQIFSNYLLLQWPWPKQRNR